MIHHAERFVLVAVFEEIDCLVGDNIRCISFFYDVLSVFPEVRVVVVALLMLAAEYAPVVKSLRFADKMPFTDHGSLITGLLFRECLLITVEGACIIGKAVLMAEFSGEDAGT